MTTTTVELRQTTCWCGTPFALPEELLNAARNRGHTVYCPHGHAVVWRETELGQVRRDRDRLKQDTARLEDDVRLARKRADKAEAANKRLKKRMAAGTCPCCQRTFQNMSIHMRKMHPQFTAEAVENVVPMKKPA